MGIKRKTKLDISGAGGFGERLRTDNAPAFGKLFFVIVIFFVFSTLVLAEQELLPSIAQEAAVTGVVYNANYAGGEKIARYYAKARGIPENNILAIRVPFTDEISHEDYLEKIETPIVREFSKRELLFSSNKKANPRAIRYLVLTRGIPFRVRPPKEHLNDKKIPPFEEYIAAVDSELASVVLRFLNSSVSFQGALKNPARTMKQPSQAQLSNGILMVARLDAPTDELAIGLVDKAIQAEKEGLWGNAVIDIRGLSRNTLNEQKYLSGDTWMRMAGERLGRRGFNVYWDENPATIPGSVSLPAVAFYAGWYEYNANGPFKNKLVEFVPGAFAYHLHSFSAEFLHSDQTRWVGPLIAQGATCTVGNVAEPYLATTLQINVFVDWLLRGASFGEAAYHALPTVSWQQTVIGDPLYRPYRFNNQVQASFAELRNPALTAWAYVQMANVIEQQIDRQCDEDEAEIEKKRLCDQVRSLLNDATTTLTIQNHTFLHIHQNLEPIRSAT